MLPNSPGVPKSHLRAAHCERLPNEARNSDSNLGYRQWWGNYGSEAFRFPELRSECSDLLGGVGL